MINFDARKKLIYSAAYSTSTEVQLQTLITEIRGFINAMERDKFTLGVKLLNLYNNKKYSNYAANKVVLQHYGYYRHCNANAEVFFAMCEIEFGLDKSTVSRYMNVVDEFGKNDPNEGLIDYYKAFKWSALVEMLSMSPDERKLVKPEMTIKQIRDLKKSLVATSQQKDKDKEPPRKEPERFKTYTRIMLIDYIEQLEDRVKTLESEAEDKEEEVA